MENTNQVKHLATILHKARINCQPVNHLSKEFGNFSEELAYQVQWQGLEFRQEGGEKIVGMKMGLTSAAKRQQMNLHSPVYGVLTDAMKVQKVFSLKGSIHSKIEPEIAFRVGPDLKAKISREEALSSIEAVAPCLEILDSRYADFKYFSLQDVIADNSSSAFFVLGPWIKDFSHLDLLNIELSMRVNGQQMHSALSKEISGDPILSLVQLMEILSAQGRRLPAGSIVLAGAATSAVALAPGMRVELITSHLGSVKIDVVGDQ